MVYRDRRPLTGAALALAVAARVAHRASALLAPPRVRRAWIRSVCECPRLDYLALEHASGLRPRHVREAQRMNRRRIG